MYSDLHRAAARGDIIKIKQLLKQGADTECRDKNKRTPLHEAACFNQAGAIDVLLNAGANIEAKSYNGETPLVMAAAYSKKEAISILLAEGADIDTQTDNLGRTPLHCAAYTASMIGNTAGLELLLINHANQGALNNQGLRPLASIKASNKFYSEVKDVFSHHQPHPKSLQACARTCIRTRLVENKTNKKVPLSTELDQLPLPKHLKTYLSFPLGI